MTINTSMKLPKIRGTGSPVNPNATEETKALWRFLMQLSGSKQYILGCSELYHAWQGKVDGDWTNASGEWLTITGHHPALVHHDYTAITTPGIGATRYANMRAHILAQAEMGCIIQLFHPIGNPTVATLDMEQPYGSDAGQNGDETGGIAPIKPGGAKHAAWRAYLSDLADFISGLVLSNGKKVPVIWRPFHECTPAAYYWWSGPENAADFKIVWADMVDYMVTTKECNNVLFNLNYDAAAGDSVSPWINWYAGDQYVDIIGFDSYENDSVMTNSIRLDSNGLLGAGYQACVALSGGKKPIMLNETGYRYATASKPGVWDKGTGPYMENIYYNCCSMLLWNAPYGPGLADNATMRASFKAMVDSPYCLTLDKLNALPVFKN